MTTRCTTCANPLDHAAFLCDAETCTTCELARLRPPVDEWAIFLAALRASVRDDGTVHVNDTRPKIRGRIEPKHIGTFWRRAASEGLISHKGWEESTDSAGRNADKLARVYTWRGQQNRSAA